MGTNYYANFNQCDCCGRKDTVHIGKSFRILRAYPANSITGHLGSWADWQTWLTTNDVEIEDEYGLSHDIDWFIGQWKPVPEMAERVRVQNAQWRRNYGSDLGDYLDPQGFCLSPREFS